MAPERGGDFSDRGVQLFDPRSRAPLGSRIPTDKLPLDPAALGLLRFIPLPNLPGLVQNFHLQTRVPTASDSFNVRSEEHTSELQSRPHLVCRLLLEKKNKRREIRNTTP